MRQYKWKKSLCMFLALLMLFSTFSTPQATFSADNVDVIENAVEEYVKSWFFENFSEHYILSDYSSSVSELTITGDEILATVPLGAYTTLKYTSVDSLPYMLGIKEKLNISSLAEIVPADFAQKYGKAAVAELRKSVDYGVETSSSSAVASKLSMDSKGNSALTTKRAVDTLKNSMHITSAQAEDIISLVANNFVDAAECIGVPTLLTLEISFAAKYNSDGTFSNVTIEQRHGDYAVESESEIKPLSFEDLKKSAEEEIDVCLASDLSSLQAVVPLAAADNYNRVAARDYAWQHTAPGYGYHQNDPDLGGYTPSTTCGHTFYDKNGNKTYVYVDRSFWNTTDYPSCMALGHCHNDCACFVSQCMVAGGILPTSDWYYGSLTWVSASRLIDFITSNEVGGYAVTYKICNAGNIVYWEGHITLCTLNDTVSHRYTGHTNDRNNSKFSSADAYYAINLA